VTEGTARRQELVSRNFETSNQVRDLQHRRSQLTQELHDAELQIARQEIRLSQTGERLEVEYAITLEEALQREDPPTVSKETANEVARLRREVRQMGEVNTGAVEEYDRLTERHEFLNTQQADLEQARTSLLETIAEIDDSTRGVFMETFDAVATEFQSLFTRLFGGGETKLSLTQPDNLLDTGIEIIAKPPGKKPMSLSLLSGGERALTAVALIFSFLAVKPAPFVVLDEVDAPLDGTNVEKFAQLVAEFSQRSQFLVITHNPTTMEASPRWYGVTMSEAGVSRVMAYRVPEEATASEPEQAVVREINTVTVVAGGS
jgi:chromosome segregation protein